MYNGSFLLRKVFVMNFFDSGSAFNIFNALALIGGLCLFLFGMNIMGQALERRAGNKLRPLLAKMTEHKFKGFLTGLGITSIIQSSSATTVMVVGFVNSGLMTLKQATNVIIGANVGTTVTGWILSLTGISGDNIFVNLLKPSSFVPVLALFGIVMLMMSKKQKAKDTGTILLGFATLMFGMEAMSDAVSGLAEIEGFRNLFIAFENPFLGILVGAALTCIIQSSSASVGILQALSSTGQVSIGASVPIVMGDGIGTCITAVISSIGAKREAKRAAVIHLVFNIIGTAFCMTCFCVAKYAFLDPMGSELLSSSASELTIAIANTAFKVASTLLILPMSSILEKIARKVLPATKEEKPEELDTRLYSTPELAIEHCRTTAAKMADNAFSALKEGMSCIDAYSSKLAESVRKKETKTDKYEDMLSEYLVGLTALPISEDMTVASAKLLKSIGDFERIADHAVNLVEAAEELKDKNETLSETAKTELAVLEKAVTEVLDRTYAAFSEDDPLAAEHIEPLEQVVDGLKEQLRTNHVLRLQNGGCSMEVGFVWADILTDLERVSDHCSNIADCIIDAANNSMNMHEEMREEMRTSPEFARDYEKFEKKYALPER